ncbi:hypothetical protein GGS20DRAFT_555234 [Poronia punctata]|nr:hypothetical protein GGS20DRAFT_555234 [Poronia punctata]
MVGMMSSIKAVKALGVGMLCSTALAAVAQPTAHRYSLTTRDTAEIAPLAISVQLNNNPGTLKLNSGTTKGKTSACNLDSNKPIAHEEVARVGEKLDKLSVYVTGNKVTNPPTAFMAKPNSDGSSSYYVPSGSHQGKLLGIQSSDIKWQLKKGDGAHFKTPGAMSSGRIYVSNGDLQFYASPDGAIVQPDPHNPEDISSRELWGFIEFSHVADPSSKNETITVNLSFVDWVALPLGMNVTYQDGKTASVPGLKADGLVNICNELSGLDSFWPKLCMKGADKKTPIRIVSPNKYLTLHPEDHEAATYYEPYIDMVWNKYKTSSLKINTQSDGPNGDKKVANGTIITCTVKGDDDKLECDNDAGTFDRPTTADIYGCNSGPFANGDLEKESWSRARVRPRLCAAFVRSTAHLDGEQPSRDIPVDMYYKYNVTNHYARAVHENLIGGMGYAFSYDDVSADESVNTAGLVSVEEPLALDVFVNMA